MTDPEAALRETLSDLDARIADVTKLHANSGMGDLRAYWEGYIEGLKFARHRVEMDAPLLTPTAWQSMETAPKDCEVLVYWPGVTEKFPFEAIWSEPTQRWKAAGVTVEEWLKRSQPTHWMPLPLPPAQKERAWQPPQITGPLQQIELSHLQARLTLAGVVQAARRWHPKGTVYSWPHEFDTALKAAETYLSTQPLPPAPKERQG